MTKWITGAGALLFAFFTQAQSAVSLEFAFRNNNQPFALDQAMPAVNGVAYSIQDAAFFVSRVVVIHDGGQETALDSNTVFYINYLSSLVELGTLHVTNIEGIRFDTGVPDYLNHLDISQYPSHHPLGYHTPSMHWGWSAGYMHLVVNATGDDNNDGTPNTVYQLHCLGDENVHTVTVPTIATPYGTGAQRIVLNVNIDEWLRGTSPATTGAVHGSDGVNAAVMQNVNDYPVFTSPATAGIVEKADQVQIAVVQLDKGALLSWKDDVQVASYRLTDADGRVLATGNCTSNTLTLSGLHTGLHFVRLFSASQQPIGTVKWIVP